jgi:hypothetical protein
MSLTRWLDLDEQQTWRTFLSASRLLMETLDRELRHDAGIPHAYYEILVRLSEAPGRKLRMSDLAEATGSSRSRLSHAVARLEESGWARREGCRPTGAATTPSSPTPASRCSRRLLPTTSRAYADTCSTSSPLPRLSSCARSARHWSAICPPSSRQAEQKVTDCLLY